MNNPFKIAKIFSTSVIMIFNVFVLLQTFVLSQGYTAVQKTETQALQLTSGNTNVSSNSYSDENISITLDTIVQNETTIYIADIQIEDPGLLKSALAQDTYGHNVTQTVSEMAQANNAILAINGDYYGADESGYVIRDGVIYRDTATDQEDFVIFEDGHVEIINEMDISAQELVDQGAITLLAFGPTLVENSQVVVDTNAEVGKAMTSNPRTAIGIIDEGHYVFVVSDGRTQESEGLSLYEITTNGKNINEREVSDIVYIGY